MTNMLLPELESSLRATDGGCWLIHNPLIVQYYVPGEETGINQNYVAKRDRVAEMEADGDWSMYLWLHERAYRIGAFDRIKDQMSDKEYWEMLGLVYTDQEIVHHQWPKLRKLLQSPRPHREFIMSEEDRAIFADLPEELSLFRGFCRGNGKGWSWTLEEDTAIWFANRLAISGSRPSLLVGTAMKKDTIAYFGERDENEILIDPERVTVVEKRRLESELE
jgi:hypothetical protein